MTPAGWLLLLLAFLMGRSGKKGGGGDLTNRVAPATGPVVPPVASRPLLPVVTTKTAPVLRHAAPEPWPQVVPSDVPPFPGSAWEPDIPPSTEVSSRAAQLLPVLWSHGKGTHKIERVGGDWRAFKATLINGKKGVVAYRLRITAEDRASVEPSPVSARTVPASAPATALPTLRRGSKGEDVRLLQSKLPLVEVDGDFGPKTEQAVRNYQTANGLQVDGIVGPQTWASLFGRTSA